MEADDQTRKCPNVQQADCDSATFYGSCILFNVFGPLRHSIENQDGAFDWAQQMLLVLG